MSDSDVYTAEKILAKRNNRGVTQYLIKWMNFPRRDSTWEPVENVLDPSLLDTFYQEKRGPKRKYKKATRIKLESPRPSQSRDRSPTRSPAARATPNSLSPEPRKLVLDESLVESDQTIDDDSPVPEQSDANQESEPQETVSIETTTTTDATPPRTVTPAAQPVHDARPPTPKRPAYRQSPVSSPSSANQAPRNLQSSPIARRSPFTDQSATSHQSSTTQQPAARKQSPAPQQMLISQPLTNQLLPKQLLPKPRPPASPQQPVVRQSPAPQQPAARQLQAPQTMKTRHSPAPTNSVQTTPKIQVPIQNSHTTNNHRLSNGSQPRAVPPKSRKFAVMNTWITDVYTDRADYTVTLSESPRDHGFFRDSSKNGIDATTQF